MGFEFTDDDPALNGQRAIYFPHSEAGHDCETLGYQCIVVGQVRSKFGAANRKRFLILVECSKEPITAEESEIIFCKGNVHAPTQVSGELAFTFQSKEEIAGSYRASEWAPRSSFVFQLSEILAPNYGIRKSDDEGDLLIYEAPLNTVLGPDYIITALAKITGQPNWRLLPCGR